MAQNPVDKERVATEDSDNTWGDMGRVATGRSTKAKRRTKRAAQSRSADQGPVNKDPVDRERVAKEDEEQRQVATREAARFATPEAENRQDALEEAQRQVATREAKAMVMYTASEQGKAKKTSLA